MITCYDNNIEKPEDEDKVYISKYFQHQPREDNAIPLTTSEENSRRYKNKRFRSAFTTTQLTMLEKEFKKDAYVNNVRREELSNKLRLSERTIKIWFQNRRMKEKRECERTDSPVEPNIDLEDNKPINTNKELVTDLNIRQASSQVNLSKFLKTIEKDRIKDLIQTKPDSRKKAISEKVTVIQPKKSITTKKTDSNTIIKSGNIQHTNDLGKDASTSKNIEESFNKHEDTSKKEQVTNSIINPDLSMYYNSLRNHNWDPYGLVPVIASGHPLNRYALPTNYSSNPHSSNTKCNCNCHEVRNDNAINLQQNYPFFYTHYLPHILSLYNQNR